MKKLVVTLLVVLFTLSTAGAVFAAEKLNPYSDVPANHWAYESVKELYRSGIMEGWDSKFHGDSNLTRYEVAAITARAMAKIEKADAATRAQIEKLAAEFSNELVSLGVRVEALEKKTDNVTITGEVRARYINQKTENGHHKNSTTTQDMRARIHASGKINDTWRYWARLEGTEDFKKSGADAKIELTGGYIEGTFGKWNATLGRFDYLPVNGLVFDETLDGVKLSYADGAWQTNLVYGRTVDSYGLGTLAKSIDQMDEDIDGFDVNPKQATLEVRYAVNDNLNLAAAYHKFDVKLENGSRCFSFDESFKSAEFGFKYKIDKDWALNGSYAKTSLPGKVEHFAKHIGLKKGDLNSAYLVGVSYKGADPKVEGTWGVYANYRNMKPLSTWASTYDSTNVFLPLSDSLGIPLGFKGYEVGFDYAPYKNTKLKMYYIDGKPTISEASDRVDQKYYRAQLEVFF